MTLITTAVLAIANLGNVIGQSLEQPPPKLSTPPPPPMQTAVASWYDDSGTTASGRHYTYGYASLLFGSDWGHAVRFCYQRCVIGRLDDHGPYVTGRLFDLNPQLKEALGCPDLCTLRWRNA
jgi:hypothetical protein